MLIGCAPQDEEAETEEKELLEETGVLGEYEAQDNGDEAKNEEESDQEKGEEEIKAEEESDDQDRPETDSSITHEVDMKTDGVIKENTGEEWWKDAESEKDKGNGWWEED